MKFFTKAKDWLVAHKPTKRRIIQLYAALLTNAHLKGFGSGEIYTGSTKKACVPGLNCYSCPGAVGACPLGALQDSLSKSGATVPAYIFGILILFGLMLGRMICSFLCPFGLIQELLYKIRTPKLRKSRFTRILSYFKYVMLALVISLPVLFVTVPAFCQYVCPAGMLEGSVPILSNIANAGEFSKLNYLFTWKFCVMVAVLVASVFIYRFFCRFICPLGAIYSLFNRISLLGVRLDKNKCIDCGLCIQGCKMDVKKVGDHECIMCGECISVCPVQAISWKGSQLFVHPTSPLAQPAVGEPEKIDLLQLAQSNSQQVVLSQPAQTESATVEEVEEGATVKETVEQPRQPEQPRKEGRAKAIKAAFKKPRFVVEFTAWVVAICVLIAALVCFNLPEKKEFKAYGVGEALPTVQLESYNGKEGFSTENCLGKVTVINFWYTGCGPCKNELPEFNEVYKEYAGAINMYAVHAAGNSIPPGGVQNWLDTHTDKNGLSWSEYSLTFSQDTNELNFYKMLGGRNSFPITIIVDESGTIVSSHGEYSKEKLIAAIEQAMNK